MAWTDELKNKVIEAYEAGNPTPENSTELIKEIAEEIEQSPNGICAACRAGRHRVSGPRFG